MAKLTRRDWLKLFSAGAVGALVLDPEKLLWVPGEKTIFLPPVFYEVQPIYSLWQLQIRAVDTVAPNEFSTAGLLGRQTLDAQWQEIFRTDSVVLLQERINGVRRDQRDALVADPPISLLHRVDHQKGTR